MANKLTQKKSFTPWISTRNLLKLKIKQYGHIGGCILIHYVITVDGKKYFIK